MFKLAIPVLHVSSSVAAEKFYCDCLGFRQKFAYRPFGGPDLNPTRHEMPLICGVESARGYAPRSVFRISIEPLGVKE